jgi:mannose-6-phosphate isomerase-like protein (cupin superfamily)
MNEKAKPDTIKLAAGTGRIYDMPGMSAIFKADEAETEAAYSISEWWLEPRTRGPGAHSHAANDEVFYGIGGVMTVLVGEDWHDIAPGDFLRIPAGTIHDFENRTGERAGLLNFYIPGGFERDMPAIVDWFKVNR